MVGTIVGAQLRFSNAAADQAESVPLVSMRRLP